jgi:hypothetical protein
MLSGFEPEPNETDYLKRRLREEKAKSAKAERARREAESRCLEAERERVSFPPTVLRRLFSIETKVSPPFRQFIGCWHSVGSLA